MVSVFHVIALLMKWVCIGMMGAGVFVFCAALLLSIGRFGVAMWCNNA